jgi:hypothetical protein
MVSGEGESRQMFAVYATHADPSGPLAVLKVGALVNVRRGDLPPRGMSHDDMLQA